MTRPLLLLALVFACAAGASAQQLVSDEQHRESLKHFRAGMEFLSGERFDLAAEAFGKAVQADPLFTVAHYQLGQAYMGLRRYASAVKAYEDSIEAGRALFNIAQTARYDAERARDDKVREMRVAAQQQVFDGLRGIRLQQHLQDLERQTTSLGGTFHPSAGVLLALGSARFRNGDRMGAEADWLAAVKTDSKLGEAHNNLAAIYAMSGRKKEGIEEVKLAERAGFRVNPQLKADLNRLPKEP